MNFFNIHLAKITGNGIGMDFLDMLLGRSMSNSDYEFLPGVALGKEIDLGIKTKLGTEIQCKWKNSEANNHYLYQSDSSVNGTQNTSVQCDQILTTRFGSSKSFNDYSLDTIYTSVQNRNGFWLNDEKVASYDSHMGTFTSNQNLTFGNTVSRVTYYSLKVIENGTVLFNLVPAERKSDGVKGMYDKVHKYFYEGE